MLGGRERSSGSRGGLVRAPQIARVIEVTSNGAAVR